jgi:phosphatidylserine synthase
MSPVVRAVLILVTAGVMVLAALSCTLLSVVAVLEHRLGSAALWIVTAMALVCASLWLVVVNGPRGES